MVGEPEHSSHKHFMLCLRPLSRGIPSLKFSQFKYFIPQRSNMATMMTRPPTVIRTISLSEQETRLRQLLIDVSSYIGSLEGYEKPELRITGGWVRDRLLGIISHDIDIGIDTMTGLTFGTLMKQYLALPETRVRYSQDMLGGLAKIEANPEKSKHLETITTKILGFDIDLVNLRKETYTEESRNPVMEFGTPQEDALRRDATVNALFYNLETSEVEDFTERGLEDMGKCMIRTPLAPVQTFKDDPLRILRLVRFASRLEYKIGDDEKNAMRETCIKDALKLKISRERVGVEVTKMLKGPHPHEALKLIDELDLYNDIFTDPTSSQLTMNTQYWHRAYDQLQTLTHIDEGIKLHSQDLAQIAEILIRNEDDIYLSWMMACFVPWAKQRSLQHTTKRLPSPACIAARQGIKADNKISNRIDDAVYHREEIIALMKASILQEAPTSSPLKRKEERSLRVAQGLAIRHWGSHWRSSVMYTFLTQMVEVDSELGMIYLRKIT